MVDEEYGEEEKEERFRDIVEAWQADPQKMVAWRTEEYKYLLLFLDDKVRNPGGGGRAGTNQFRAIALLNQMMAAMDTVKDQIPAKCPKCNHRFVPGA